ncbi:MAG: hypothetical protein CL879_10115 [Dehalococcoidia bacterium]|nr:hypothetical protein [Dehalococcoidia bacterium]
MNTGVFSNRNIDSGATDRNRPLLGRLRWTCRVAINSIPSDGPRNSHTQVGGAHLNKFYQESRI